MYSFGVQIPLTYDSISGFTELTSVKKTIKQNLKMLLLTNPGERVMDARFGVGIKRILFENFSSVNESEVEELIKQQVRTYLPVITGINVIFPSVDQDNNYLGIRIEYSIAQIATTDFIEITI